MFRFYELYKALKKKKKSMDASYQSNVGTKFRHLLIQDQLLKWTHQKKIVRADNFDTNGSKVQDVVKSYVKNDTLNCMQCHI